MKIIPLTKDKVTSVDDDDYEWLIKHKWQYLSTRNGYAIRGYYENGKCKHYYMHRLITKCPENMQVDHINGNSLDNRKSNLRICTHSQNLHNSRKQRGIRGKSSSMYKGVRFMPREIKGMRKITKHRKNWNMYIYYKKKRVYGGVYNTEKEAAVAYNILAPKYHGEFFRPNIIE